MTVLTILRRAPTVYIDADLDAFITDDQGELVPTCYGQLSTFINNEFTSIPAALEYYGVPAAPLPALI